MYSGLQLGSCLKAGRRWSRKTVVSMIPCGELRNYSLLMDLFLVGGFQGSIVFWSLAKYCFISSDPTDTNDLRQIRNWVGETFCRNDPSPLSSTLTGFGYLALIHWIHRSTDRSSCRNRLDLYRCQANSTNEEFQLPLLLIFPSRSPSVWHLITHPRCVTPIINNNNVLFPPL